MQLKSLESAALIEVTAAILRSEDRIFIARRAEGKHLEGYWEFPGGKIEGSESGEACLARELAEEFGIDVNVGVYLGESIFDYGTKVVRLQAFEVEYLGGEILPVDHDEVKWVTNNQLEGFKWAPADIPFVNKLISGEW